MKDQKKDQELLFVLRSFKVDLMLNKTIRSDCRAEAFWILYCTSDSGSPARSKFIDRWGVDDSDYDKVVREFEAFKDRDFERWCTGIMTSPELAELKRKKCK